MPAPPSGQGDVVWHIPRQCDGGACVMVTRHGDTILIGNVSHPSGPYLSCTIAEWNAFLLGARCGDFDELG